jgi:hypothetical protein
MDLDMDVADRTLAQEDIFGHRGNARMNPCRV